MSVVRRALAVQGPSSVVVIAVSCAAAYLGVLSYAIDRWSFDVWGGVVIFPILMVLTVPFALSAARADGDSTIAWLIMGAFVLKLCGAVARYYVAFSVYGSGDSQAYHDVGVKLAPMFRHGDFSIDLGKRVLGTGFIEIVTGAVYTVTGATKLGGFFVFSWLGFIGMFLFYRAFRIAFPDGDRWRYALLVFFLPSLLFWPSSIGKESWMMFMLGLVSYGVARMLSGMPFGLPAVILGLAGSAMVRPHVALIAIVALLGGYLVRRSPRPTLLGPPAKVAMLVILSLGTIVVLSQVKTFFGVSTIDSGSAEQVLTRTTEQTSQGGSEAQVTRPSSPAGVLEAVVAVVFRPWPYEATNLQSLFASLEGLFLLGLILMSLRRFAALPRAMIRRPYVTYALVYCLVFLYAFSSIGNFGILSRQRVQLYPFLAVLLCVPVQYGLEATRRNTGSSPRVPLGVD